MPNMCEALLEPWHSMASFEPPLVSQRMENRTEPPTLTAGSDVPHGGPLIPEIMTLVPIKMIVYIFYYLNLVFPCRK